jgi:hypothetical protein
VTTQRASLDHLTVAALTLEQGVAYVQRALGATVPAGGAHPLMATHNCLMQLGEAVFLEIIAPDPAASPERPRWFALDDVRMLARVQRSPQLVSWVVRVPDLGKVLHELGGSPGEAVRVTRGSLSWLISVLPDGSMPFDGAFPTLIEWPAGPHPYLHMTDLNCRLEHLAIAHPESDRLTAALDPVFRDERVSISSGTAVQLRATIKTPDGLHELT